MSATSTMSAVAELEANLQAMLSLKPPGVSGSKVTNITALCVANVQVRYMTAACPKGEMFANIQRTSHQSESVLIQKIFTHFKKAPPTHKLGVLYIVDSVTRKWTDLAKSQGQAVNTSAQDGTYAAGVQRVTDLMPVLMNDIIQTAPADQKVSILKRMKPQMLSIAASRLRGIWVEKRTSLCCHLSDSLLHLPLRNAAEPHNLPLLSYYRKRLRSWLTSGTRE